MVMGGFRHLRGIGLLDMSGEILARDEGVEHRHHEQSEDRADNHAAENHQAHRVARGSTSARGDDQRHDAERHRRRGHQDRPQAYLGRSDDRLAARQPMLFALLVGEFDQQDAVLGDQSYQCDQADLGVDVECAKPEIERHDGAEDRQRHRHHDDERVAEAFELRRQDQVDHHDREAEGDQDRAALLALQTRLACIVDEETGRQQRPGDLLQRLQTITGGNTNHRQCRDGRRIELIELLDRRRRGVGLDRHHGRQRHHLPVDAADEELAELLRVVPVLLRHLHDDVVAVRIAVELGNRPTADKQAQRRADIADRQVERCRPVAIDGHGHLWRIERQRVRHVKVPMYSALI
eukprot:Opistho-1_new@9345